METDVGTIWSSDSGGRLDIARSLFNPLGRTMGLSKTKERYLAAGRLGSNAMEVLRQMLEEGWSLPRYPVREQMDLAISYGRM